jgi:hypothetical protein
LDTRPLSAREEAQPRAIATFQRILQVAETSRNHLRDPWLIDQNEEQELRQAGFLMIDPGTQPPASQMRHIDVAYHNRA